MVGVWVGKGGFVVGLVVGADTIGTISGAGAARGGSGGAVVTGRGNADVALYDFATEQQQLQPDAQVFSPQDGAYLDDSADSDSDVDESLFNRQPQNASVDPTADAYLQVGEEEEREEEENNGEKSDVE